MHAHLHPDVMRDKNVCPGVDLKASMVIIHQAAGSSPGLQISRLTLRAGKGESRGINIPKNRGNESRLNRCKKTDDPESAGGFFHEKSLDMIAQGAGLLFRIRVQVYLFPGAKKIPCPVG